MSVEQSGQRGHRFTYTIDLPCSTLMCTQTCGISVPVELAHSSSNTIPSTLHVVYKQRWHELTHTIGLDLYLAVIYAKTPQTLVARCTCSARGRSAREDIAQPQ